MLGKSMRNWLISPEEDEWPLLNGAQIWTHRVVDIHNLADHGITTRARRKLVSNATDVPVGNQYGGLVCEHIVRVQVGDRS